MEVQIYCCSTVDYVAAGEWVFIEGATEEVEVTFVDQQGGKKTVEMFVGDKVALPFVGLHLRSKGDNQVIKLRTGWGDFTPSQVPSIMQALRKLEAENAEDAEDEETPPDPQMQYMCVDVTSPVPNLEKQTESMWSKDIEIPANDSATIALWSARYDMDIKVSKVLIQNASETLTRCRIRDPEDSGSIGGLWLVGGGGSIGQIDWFDVGSIGTLNVYNESNETALISVNALLYRDVGNACRYDSYIS
ncbi:hypothetical protein [Terasakiella pusilla]|uniref:hypothetical protein n=1 Tax=Terasakiella pusilla TaxID=64973 RepID=UPI003AA92B51